MFLSFWIGLMGFVVVIVLLLSFPGYQIGVAGGYLCSCSVFPCFVICEIFPYDVVGGVS